MKNKLWLLIKAQISVFSSVKLYKNIKTSRGVYLKPKRRRSPILYALLGIYILAAVWFYCKSLMQLFDSQGIGAENILALMFFAGTILALVTGVFSGGKTLFAYKDYDLVMSMPIPVKTVVASQVIVSMVFQTFPSYALLIPAGVAYGMFGHAAPLFPLIYLLLLIVFPIIPGIISTFLGTLVTLISSRFGKSGNKITIILLFIFIIAIIGFSFSFSFTLNTNPASLIPIADSHTKVYPIAPIFKAAVTGSLLNLIAFVLLSVLPLIALCLIIAQRYRQICSRVTTVSAKAKKLRAADMRVSGRFKAQYLREGRLYTSSPIYVSNTGTGALLSILLCAILSFNIVIPDIALNTPGFPSVKDYVLPIIPILAAMLISMSCTSCSSISIEGESLWIIKSLPAGAITFFKAKILLNLTLTIPTAIICSAIICIGFKTSFVQTILAFALPLSAALFSAVFGLLINLRHPKLSWKSESEVVKRSAASFIGTMPSFIVGIILMTLTGIFIGHYVLVSLLAIALLIAAAALIYRYLGKNGDRLLLEL